MPRKFFFRMSLVLSVAASSCATPLPLQKICILDPASSSAACYEEKGDPKHPTYEPSLMKIGDMNNYVCQSLEQWQTTMQFCGIQVYGVKP
jgi:hypothetical protein